MDFLEELHASMGLDANLLSVPPRPEAKVYSSFYIDLQLVVSKLFTGKGLHEFGDELDQIIAERFPDGIPLSAITARAIRGHKWRADNTEELNEWDAKYYETHHPDGTPKALSSNVPHLTTKHYGSQVDQAGHFPLSPEVWMLDGGSDNVKLSPFLKKEELEEKLVLKALPLETPEEGEEEESAASEGKIIWNEYPDVDEVIDEEDEPITAEDLKGLLFTGNQF